ncbi:hypothetical protein [Ehrlichia ruminantium]|uniref:hypothetical protein n=1 Tax=Ehrlichia ruminantium TaxID=779 RepID=UPI00130DEFEB|nr:hypothetical protein [Ehrlichia ruminantium]
MKIKTFASLVSGGQRSAVLQCLYLSMKGEYPKGYPRTYLESVLVEQCVLIVHGIS